MSFFLYKLFAIQKISVTLSSVIIAIAFCKLLIAITFKIQQYSLTTVFLLIFI